MNAYFLIMNNKRFRWKNCCSHTLKFKLEREISWWQTHKLIILMITGRTARLRLEIYPETGWDVMTCYSHHTEILNTYAMKSWFEINKGNFPYNLDNTLSIVQFPFWNKHCHPEQCSSKRATEWERLFSVLSAYLTLISACLRDVRKNQARRLTNRPAL